jgi:4-hydroxy-2-oxoheptanedioate aldolase
MAEIPRLNGVIRALEQGQSAFVTFSPAEIGAAQAINAAPYDGVVFEMEHRPYDIRSLRDCLQFMLDRRQILRSGSLAPQVTPFVRIPPMAVKSASGSPNKCLIKVFMELCGPM